MRGTHILRLAVVAAGLVMTGTATSVPAASRPPLQVQGIIDRPVLYVADTKNHRIQRSTDGGATWESLGNGKGKQPGQFLNPSGVAASASGTRIFVADTGNHRIQRSLDGGTTWEVMGGRGSKIGRFKAPLGLAYNETDQGLGANDILFVADTLNNRVQCAVGASTFEPEWALYAGPGRAVGRVRRPAGLAISANGDVWIADCGNNRIEYYTLDNSGKRYVAKIFAGATHGRQVGRMLRPTALHVDEQNRVYVADTGNSRIQVNTDGTAAGWSVLLPKGTAVGSVRAPEGVTVTDSGDVYIADTGNHRIQRVPAGGTAAQAQVVGAKGTETGLFNKPTKIR